MVPRSAIDEHQRPAQGSDLALAQVRDLHVGRGNPSADRDRARWDRLIGLLGSTYEARRLTPEVWADIRQRLGPASAQGRNRYLVTYKAGLSLALETGRLKEHPLRWARYEKVAEPRRRRIATEDEERRL